VEHYHKEPSGLGNDLIVPARRSGREARARCEERLGGTAVLPRGLSSEGLVELIPALRRLRAALAAVLVQAEAPELALVHHWLDNWHGVGLLVVGLHRIGYDLDLRQYGDGHWRATFYVTGIAHSILGSSAWEPTVWRAVQRAG
jgi:hypothetical protein